VAAADAALAGIQVCLLFMTQFSLAFLFFSFLFSFSRSVYATFILSYQEMLILKHSVIVIIEVLVDCMVSSVEIPSFL
jgi:hypothetical protein